jgi:hypothetical protein
VTDVITFNDRTPGDGCESPEKPANRPGRSRIAVIRT